MKAKKALVALSLTACFGLSVMAQTGKPAPGEQKPSLPELRTLFRGSQPLDEKDLQLGKTWVCSGVNVKDKEAAFVESEAESFVLKKIDSTPDLYQQEGPHDAPMRLVPDLGLLQNAAGIVFSLTRVTPDKKLVTETSVTQETANFIGYKSLPDAYTNEKLLAVGYQVCKARP